MMMQAWLPLGLSLLINLFMLVFVGRILLVKQEFSFFVRPSVLFVAFLYLVYLVPSQAMYNRLSPMSPAIGHASLLLAICLSLSLIMIYVVYRRFDKIGAKVKGSLSSLKDYRGPLLASLVGLLTICTLLYFSQISFTNTGLYAILCDPSHYVILREMSLKLAGIKWLGYVYLIGFSCICPFICTIYIDKLLVTRQGTRAKVLLYALPLFVFILFYLLITGARVGFLNCALGSIWLFWFRLGIRKFIPAAVFSILGALALAAMISMAWVNRAQDPASGDNKFCSYFLVTSDESKNLESESKVSWSVPQSEGFFGYFEGIINRVFVVPAVISGWYVEEGLAEGARPSYLYRPEGRRMANEFGQKYVKRLYGESYQPGNSISTPTSFVFVNFIYFGYWSAIISALGILLLDLSFILARRVAGEVSIPLMAMCLYYSFIFAQTGYFTVVLSHGYFLLVAIIFVLYCVSHWGVWVRWKKKLNLNRQIN